MLSNALTAVHGLLQCRVLIVGQCCSEQGELTGFLHTLIPGCSTSPLVHPTRKTIVVQVAFAAARAMLWVSGCLKWTVQLMRTKAVGDRHLLAWILRVVVVLSCWCSDHRRPVAQKAAYLVQICICKLCIDQELWPSLLVSPTMHT